jgi:predicted aspartyl protease
MIWRTVQEAKDSVNQRAPGVERHDRHLAEGLRNPYSIRRRQGQTSIVELAGRAVGSQGENMARTRRDLLDRPRAEMELTNSGDMALARAGLLQPAKVRRVQVMGVASPRTTRLVLPQSIVTELGLPVDGTAWVRYARKRKVARPFVRGVELKLFGREGIYSAIVEPTRADALIGMIVLNDLDLIVDPRTQKLRPRDPRTMIFET